MTETPLTHEQLRVLCAIAFIVVLALYIWYCHDRARMTSEKRKAADDDREPW
jgi:hypothetical protein